MLSMRKRYAAYHMVHIIWKINTAKLCCIDFISKNFKNISTLSLCTVFRFWFFLRWVFNQLRWPPLPLVLALLFMFELESDSCGLFRTCCLDLRMNSSWTLYSIDYDVSISSFGIDILSIFYSFYDGGLELLCCNVI